MKRRENYLTKSILSSLLAVSLVLGGLPVSPFTYVSWAEEGGLREEEETRDENELLEAEEIFPQKYKST